MGDSNKNFYSDHVAIKIASTMSTVHGVKCESVYGYFEAAIMSC